MIGLRAAKGSEAGFTLVEVMVTLVLLSIAGVMMLNFLGSTTEATTRAGANVEAESEAQIVLRTMTQDIRSAISINTVYPGSPVCPSSGSFASPYAGFKNCIAITIARPSSSASETCPSTEVAYGLNGGVLRTNRKEFQLVSGVCTVASNTTGKVVVTDLVNTTVQPLFTFYDGQANDLVGAATPKVPTSAASVKITLVKRYRRLSTPDLTLSSVVALRNNR